MNRSAPISLSKSTLLWCVLLGCTFASLQGQLAPDPNFGDSGKVQFSFAPFHSVADIAGYGANHILVTGQCGNLNSAPNLDILLVKMDFQGELDPSFGDSGKVKIDLEALGMSTGNEIQVLPDGRILVLGEGFELTSVSDRKAGLLMLYPNGQVDSSFGSNGTQLLSFFGAKEYPKTLKMDRSQQILFGGASLETGHGGTITPTAARLTQAGLPDSSFGGTGYLALHPDSINMALKHIDGGLVYDLLPLANGKLVVAGTYSTGLGYNVGFISRLHPNGQLDSTFNGTGSLYLNLAPGTNHQINRLLPLANGEFVFTASSLVMTGMDFMIGKVAADGSSVDIEFLEISGDDEIRDIVAFEEAMLACGTAGNQFGFAWFPDKNNLSISQVFQLDFAPGFASEGQAITLVDENLLVCAGRVENGVSGESDMAVVGLRVPSMTPISSSITEIPSEIKVFPNPAQDQVSLSFSHPTLESGTISLLSSTGTLLFQQSLTAYEEIQLSTAQWASGMYHILWEGPSEQTVHKRLMIRH